MPRGAFTIARFTRLVLKPVASSRRLAAARQGIIHRDIKPANVHHEARSRKLLDFGTLPAKRRMRRRRET